MTSTKFQFKIGDKVRFLRRHGGHGPLPVEGRVAGSDRRSNGVWVSVNLAPKGANPKLLGVRPSKLLKI